MNTRNISINDVIKQLKKFSVDVLEWKMPVGEEVVLSFEHKFDIKLPDEFVLLLKETNGFSLMGIEIVGFSTFNNEYGLEETYCFEHFDVENIMPNYLIPFSPDGYGNHYCFDVKNHNIVFWEHDSDYTQNKPIVVCKSLATFIQDIIIDEILKDYDYEGRGISGEKW